jgi:hypothetical protein
MPTSKRRIPVVQDEALAEALAVASPFYAGRSTAGLVHDLAIKGAQAVQEEEVEKRRRLEALVAFSTEQQPLIDWDVLGRVDELAWGEE